MDDVGDLLAGILADTLPDAHHVAAGGVDDGTTALGQLIPDTADLRPEGGDHHRVALAKIVDIRRLVAAGEKRHAHVPDLLVDVRVVDDLAEDVDRLFGGEMTPRRVGQVDRPFDAVTESKLLGQAHTRFAVGEFRAVGADVLHERTPVMRHHLGFDLLHDVRSADVDSLGLFCARHGVESRTGRPSLATETELNREPAHDGLPREVGFRPG